MTRIALVAGLLAGSAAFAAQAFAFEPYLPHSPKSFGRLDADGNGKITAAEIMPRAEKRLLRFDADKNGAVTAAEIDDLLQKALQRRRERIMLTLDANKDGVISQAELDQFVTAMVDGADADKDGGVTLDEARTFKLLAWRKAFLSGQSAN
jgi:Ca2+-binding EF-hand superfamily protein